MIRPSLIVRGYTCTWHTFGRHDALLDVMTNCLTSWCVMIGFWCHWRHSIFLLHDNFWPHDKLLTSWWYNELFEVMTNFLSSWHIFDIMTNFWCHGERFDVMIWFWHYDELIEVLTSFWRHGNFFYIMTHFWLHDKHLAYLWRHDKAFDVMTCSTWWHLFDKPFEIMTNILLSWRVYFMTNILTSGLTFWRYDVFLALWDIFNIMTNVLTSWCVHDIMTNLMRPTFCCHNVCSTFWHHGERFDVMEVFGNMTYFWTPWRTL